MADCCADIGVFFAGGGDCFLFLACFGLCHQYVSWICFPGNRFAVSVAASRKRASTAGRNRIEDRMEVEKIILGRDKGRDFLFVLYFNGFL